MLSGLFRCVCFAVVFFCCSGGCAFFAVWAGAMPLPKQKIIKQIHTQPPPSPPPARTAKKNNAHPSLLIASLPSLIFSKNVRALHVRGRFVFFVFADWAGCMFYLLFWCGGGREGGRRGGGAWFHVLLFGRWACLIFPRGEGGWEVCVFIFFAI